MWWDMNEKMTLYFTIQQVTEQSVTITKFTNNMPYKCIIQIRPVPPKRTYIDAIIVPKDSTVIFDNEPIDLTRIAITFEEI